MTAELYISVVVPAYKVNITSFTKCLNSIVSQDGPFVECIVVFDGEPSDDLLAIESKFSDCRFVTIEHGGVSRARNVGIRLASGKYIAFVDADDELPEHSLKHLCDYAEAHSCDIVQGAYDAVFPSSVEHHAYHKEYCVFEDLRLEQFRRDILKPDLGVSLVWGKLFRRTLIVDNAIKFDTEMVVSEDTVFVFDVVNHAETIGFVPDTVYRYRRNDSSAVSNFRADYEERILHSIERMRRHIHYLSNNEYYENNFSSYVLFHLLLIQVHYLFNPDAPWDNLQRMSLYKKTLHHAIFRDALYNNNLEDFSLAKKISIYALKMEWYRVSRFISYIRQKQLSK